MPRGHKRQFKLYCLRFGASGVRVSARAGSDRVGVCLGVTRFVGATYVPHGSARWHRYVTYHIIETMRFTAVIHLSSDNPTQLQHQISSALWTQLKKFFLHADSPRHMSSNGG